MSLSTSYTWVCPAISKKPMLSSAGNTLKGIGSVMNVAESGSETWEWTGAETRVGEEM